MLKKTVNNLFILIENFSEILSIKKELKKKDIHIKFNTLKVFERQGRKSYVFKTKSNSGDLVIQIRKKNYPDPFLNFSEIKKVLFLLKEKGVLTTDIILSSKYYNVQKLVEGKFLKKRSEKDQYSDKLNEIALKLHSIQGRGFGSFHIENNELMGDFDSWIKFLKKISYEGLNKVFDNREHIHLKKRLDWIFRTYKKSFELKKGAFLHGDLQWLNIVLKDGELVLTDFELCILGDPLFEFSGWCRNSFDLKKYFKKYGKSDEEEFMLKIELYSLIRTLWALGDMKFDKKRKKDKEEAMNKFIILLDKLSMSEKI